MPSLIEHLQEQVNLLKFCLEDKQSFKKSYMELEFSGNYAEYFYEEMKVVHNYLSNLVTDPRSKNEQELEETLRRFLKIRWALIQRTSAAYLQCPSLITNVICENLALALAKPGESIAKILMGTLAVEHYGWNGTTLAEYTEKQNGPRGLAYGQFILTADLKAIIRLDEFFARQSADEWNLNHSYIQNSQGEHEYIADEGEYTKRYPQGNYAAYSSDFKPVPLSSQDFSLLSSSVGKTSEAYFNELLRRRLADQSNNLVKAFRDLIKICRDNGAFHKGSQGSPHPDAYRPIKKFFLEVWEPLDPMVKARLSSCIDSGGSGRPLSHHLLVLKGYAGNYPDEEGSQALVFSPEEIAEIKTGRYDQCIELNARCIERILNQYTPLFTGEGKGQDLGALLAKVKSALNAGQLCDPITYVNGEAILDKYLPQYQRFLSGEFADSIDFLIKVLTVDELIKHDQEAFVMWAVRYNRSDLLIANLDAIDVFPPVFRYSRWAVIFEMVCRNLVDLVRACLDRGKLDVNFSDRDGWTALHHACREGNLDMVRLLLERGANLNAVTDDLWTPLHVAVTNHHTDLVKYLLEGKDITRSLHQANDEGKLPLTLAIKRGYASLYELLIQKMPNLSDYKYRDTNLLEYILGCEDPKLIAALIKSGVALTPSQRESIIYRAVKPHWFDVVKACMSPQQPAPPDSTAGSSAASASSGTTNMHLTGYRRTTDEAFESSPGRSYGFERP